MVLISFSEPPASIVEVHGPEVKNRGLPPIPTTVLTVAPQEVITTSEIVPITTKLRDEPGILADPSNSDSIDRPEKTHESILVKETLFI